MRIRAVAAITALLLGAAVTAAQAEPVLVGGDADFDACGSQGEVSGLNPSGDNFLAVRDGPAPDAAQLDQLHAGDVVNLCDEFEGWYGVVYGDDCGVGTPVATRAPYDGPCKSGWVSMRYITVTAG